MSTFTWDARDYEKHSHAQKKWARELIAKIDLEKTEAILDIGCGDGKITAELANCVPYGRVVGIDSSKAMVELAKNVYTVSKYPNLSFVNMDAVHLAFKEQFDVVFSNAALHWIKDHGPMLKGIFRSLKSRGRVLLQMGGKGNAEGVLSVLQELQKQLRWRQYFSDFKVPYGFHGPPEYSEWLREVGFTIERVELIPKDMEHEGKAGLAAWVRTTWLPFTEQVPPEQRDQFIHEVVEKYIDRAPLDAHGKAHVAMMRLEVEASKKL